MTDEMDAISPDSGEHRVREIMTVDVFKIYPETTVGEIARLMSENGISGLPVVDAGDRVLGVVTELDMVVRNTEFKLPAYFTWLDATIYLETPGHVQERLRRTLGVTAGEIMSRPAITIEADATIEQLAEIMVEQHVNPVPVVSEGRLVGIVSRTDIIRMMAK